MRQILADENRQKEFILNGFTKVRMLSTEEVALILQELKQLQPQDNFAPDGMGATNLTHHVTFLDGNVDYKRKTSHLIRKFFSFYVERVLSGYKMLNCNFHIKPVGKGDFPIHLNWHHTADINDTTISIWCPLVDVNEENGTIQVVEGSHKIVPEISGPTTKPFFKSFEDILIERYLTPIPLKAGESLIFDDSLIHWSAINKSAIPRYAVQILCIPADKTPIFYYFDHDSPEKGFEMFECDSNYFIENTITDLVKRPQNLKSLGFVKNNNQALTVEEFAQKLKQGNEIRKKIYLTKEDEKFN